MSKETIELDREDAIELLGVCTRAIAYEESLRGHYETIYTTKHTSNDTVREIWKLKFKLKNALYPEENG